MKVHHRRSDCRGCGGTRLVSFLELGPSPLANSFLREISEAEDEALYPLDVYFCEDCTLVQLLDVIDPEVLFRDYIYVTGTSETIAAHNRGYAKTVVDLLGIGPDGLVVEAASNDGSLLGCFKDLGAKVLGVEPATNIAKMAVERGVPTLNEFMNPATGRRVREENGPARAVIGNNVLAHVDDTAGFLTACREAVAGDGLVIVEFPWLGELVERLEYDTVYHEHLCYFSLGALLKLYERVGLAVVRVDHVPVHGGSLRVYASKSVKGHAREVLAEVDRERAAGLGDLWRFRQLAQDVAKNREDLVGLLGRLQDQGASLAGYGAPAKGNTLLNYCKIGTDLLPYTVDRSPLKVGRFTPGMHIPVIPADELAKRRPDYALILAWNFADEIMRQQESYLRAGGKFIVPIPSPRIAG